MKDNIFNKEDTSLYETFDFNKEVVSVFDDMVSRSVPLYDVLQDAIVKVALGLHKGRPIWDIGCSTGNTLYRISDNSPEPLSLLGVDKSPDMVAATQEKLVPLAGKHHIQLLCDDASSLHTLGGPKPGVIVLCLLCQFLRPTQRLGFIKRLFDLLDDDGCVIMVEKTVQSPYDLNSLFISTYHEYKLTNGYSTLEIANKREALENKLIPFLPEENIHLLKEAGFQDIAVFFTWFNFQGYVALKNPRPHVL